jgi:hypothetical protein
MANNYPAITEAEEHFRQTEKRLAHEERRPQIRTAADLLGPGIAPFAVQIDHWRAPDATFNGTFWTAPGDTGAPDTTHWWLGQTEATNDGFGTQQVMTFRESALFPPITRMRQFYDPGNGNIVYSNWVSQHHVAIGDSMSSQGTTGGGWTLNGDGTATIPSLPEVTQPILWLGKNTSTTLSNNVNTTIGGWGTTILDTGGIDYDTGTDFTCEIAGTYLVIGGVKFDNSASSAGMRRLWLEKTSGAAPTGIFAQGPAVPGDPGSDTFNQVSGVIPCTVGDVLRIRGRQSSGGSLDIDADTNTMLQFKRLGP